MPYLSIKELMHPPEKARFPHSQRRELHVSVFIRKNCTPVARVLTGSSYAGMPVLQEYFNENGKQYVKFSSPEYTGCITNAVTRLAGPRRGSPNTAIWILQDKDPAHTAHKTAEFCATHAPRPINLITLPTDSPDLTPCDSSFFGVVKQRWRSETKAGNLTWEQRVDAALRIIEQTDPNPFIDEMQLRWEACELASGWHIEQELQSLK